MDHCGIIEVTFIKSLYWPFILTLCGPILKYDPNQ